MSELKFSVPCHYVKQRNEVILYIVSSDKRNNTDYLDRSFSPILYAVKKLCRHLY